MALSRASRRERSKSLNNREVLLMRKIYFIFLIGIFSFGCVSGGNEAITNPGNLAQIQEGVSTKAQVTAAIGGPMKITPTAEGELWEYSHAQTQMNPAMFLPIINLGVLASGYGTFNEMHQLSILFDSQGIVRKIAAGKMNPKIYAAPFYGRVSPGQYETLRSTPNAPPETKNLPPPQPAPSSGYAPIKN
jgi:outer membrane protein assembly factor BamE (lipoprotein component of BamABCDE complex)